jgi:hypothetical protein
LGAGFQKTFLLKKHFITDRKMICCDKKNIKQELTSVATLIISRISANEH